MVVGWLEREMVVVCVVVVVVVVVVVIEGKVGKNAKMLSDARGRILGSRMWNYIIRCFIIRIIILRVRDE